MRTLQRAVALAEVNDAALAVAEHLDLDMPRPVEVTFEINLTSSEKRHRLVLRERQHAAQLGAVVGDLHAAAAAARRRLDQYRIADRVGGGFGRVEIAHRALGEPGTVGMPSRDRRRLGRDLVAHQADMVGCRADKGKPVLFDGGGEIGVLGEKPEPGMDRVGAGDLRGGQDRGDVQIAVARGRWADAHALVGEPHIHRARVGGRVHRDRLDPHFAAGAVNAQRDLAAIGDQNLLEHRIAKCHSISISAVPYSTGCASLDQDLRDSPRRAARGSRS